ncbi:MAG TPA: 2-oxoacid:acceptor oxidoreductase family protein [Micromonosporaceae bacterium]|jgi:pyruvate ferredoxin oxidoreductase gamma subunit|nr:2-oxoacid:acceptor oxidoreductase family protein [Micromonosporaceae bacterium]
MFSVRLHGRGGQGIVTTAELLAVAVFDEDAYAQAFPTFGSERTGAPVAAYCRIDERPIRSHEPITSPDALIVADPSLFAQVDVLAGLRSDGYLVINASDAAALSGAPAALSGAPTQVCLVPATEIARRHIGRPVPGAPLLGAFAAVTGRVGLAALVRAIEERFPSKVAEANAAAAREAYQMIRATWTEPTHA